MARTGKIARLPRHLREDLNHRLQDGEPGKSLVAWLNGLPEVKACLQIWFGGRPILEQNLTEWKQGGYQEWLRLQEDRAWVAEMAEGAESLAEDAGDAPVSDRIATFAAVALGRALRSITEKPLDSPEEWTRFLTLLRELAAMRKLDHQASRFQWDSEDRNREVHRQSIADAEKSAMQPYADLMTVMRREMMANTLTQNAPPDVRDRVREALHLSPLDHSPTSDDPPQSNQIKPNQTKSNQIKPDQARSNQTPPGDRPPSPADKNLTTSR